jgi:hypothetical protein
MTPKTPTDTPDVETVAARLREWAEFLPDRYHEAKGFMREAADLLRALQRERDEYRERASAFKQEADDIRRNYHRETKDLAQRVDAAEADARTARVALGKKQPT